MKKVIRYNKLIRDRIPEIIKEAGWSPTIRILKKSEFLSAIKKKISEEAGELIRAKDKKGITDEIIDIQELLDVLASELKLTKTEFRKLQSAKRKKRGGFKKRLFLVKQEKV
jgi:predicted house-cleaning noncanonical NTP pyrophosphatase (MazG superfamily)